MMYFSSNYAKKSCPKTSLLIDLAIAVCAKESENQNMPCANDEFAPLSQIQGFDSVEGVNDIGRLYKSLPMSLAPATGIEPITKP